MKRILTIALAVAFGTAMCPAQRAVPFDKIDLHVVTWPKGGRYEAGAKFWISIFVSMNAEKGEPECRMSAQFAGMSRFRDQFHPAEYSIFAEGNISAEDMEALNKATAAATQGEAYEKTTKGKGGLGISSIGNWITTYASVKEGEGWKVTIQRNKHPKISLTTQEALELIGAYGETVTAIKWYETLFSAKELPIPNDEMKPPSGSIQSLRIPLGSIQRGNLTYSAGVNQLRTRGITHALHLPVSKHHAAGHEGDWVRDMMLKTAEATAAAERQDGYSFIGRHNETRYEITADPSEKTAELRIHPRFGYSDLFMEKADYDREAADQIIAMIKQADEIGQWLDRHHNLLLSAAEGTDQPAR